MFWEEGALEEKEGDDTDGNGGIGKVENGFEEGELLAADDWEPGGVMGVDEREVEHVNHFAVEEIGIAGAEGDEVGDVLHVGVAVVEKEAVEHAVDEVAEGAGIDERGAAEETPMVFFTDKVAEVEGAEDDGDEAEEGEDDLSEIAAKLPAPGHAYVFYKMKAEPMAEDEMFFVEIIMGFNIEF
jgi:hypothetical protein